LLDGCIMHRVHTSFNEISMGMLKVRYKIVLFPIRSLFELPMIFFGGKCLHHGDPKRRNFH